MATQIQLRRGTSAEWAAANPVLAQGEVGIDLTLGEMRLGDGVTAWAGLTSIGAVIASRDLGPSEISRRSGLSRVTVTKALR